MSYLILAGCFGVLVAAALAGFVADARRAGSLRPYLLRNGSLRIRASAQHRYFHDVGDSHG